MALAPQGSRGVYQAAHLLAGECCPLVGSGHAVYAALVRAHPSQAQAGERLDYAGEPGGIFGRPAHAVEALRRGLTVRIIDRDAAVLPQTFTA